MSRWLRWAESCRGARGRSSAFTAPMRRPVITPVDGAGEGQSLLAARRAAGV